jgi:hypothetical protein
LNHSPDDVYEATYKRVIDKNKLYYERYPEDVKQAKDIANYLSSHKVDLPSGGRLSPRRFQQLGTLFGMSYGFERVHYLLEQAFVGEGSAREIGYAFMRGFENNIWFETNPLYAVLQEPIYCEQMASNWSAQRIRKKYPEFNIIKDRTVFFTGEMVYPWMFDEYKHLRPLKEAAENLAKHKRWPRLYNKTALQANAVPCAAVIYYNDMYVERTFSIETAHNIRGIRLWITNEYEHDGLRADGEKVLGRLLDMLHGEA